MSEGTTDTNRRAHLQHKLQMDAKTRSPREWCCPGETIQSTEGPDRLPQEVREEGERPSYQSLCAFMEYLRGPLTATHGMQIRHFVYLTGTAKVRHSCSATCSPRSAEDLTQEIHGQVILSTGQVDINALTCEWPQCLNFTVWVCTLYKDVDFSESRAKTKTVLCSS